MTGVGFSKNDVVEGYRVLSELGQGAASRIYLVQHEKTKQIRAMKQVCRDTEKDQRFLDQAEQEYQVASKLDHPRLRKIHKMIKRKVKLVQVRELLLVMELVDGMSLDVKPPKTFEEAIEVFAQVSDGMHHMHERGFVHADMKPNNIIVNDQNEAKVIDLGQSCAIGTIKKRIQGTPDYIAPEQVHRREITPKTDVYNLGASMYWVLTRRHVPSALGSEESLLGRIDDAMIEKATPAAELNPRIPTKLNDLIMACVDINPDKRPLDMKRLGDTLRLVHGVLVSQQSSRRGTDVA
ncbi:MAG: serine/threonine-protein kinase [Planctomycetota bacterium]